MRLNMSVQSELHGLAALQWSICLDSLNRYVQKLQAMPELIMGPTRLCSTRIDDSLICICNVCYFSSV